MVQLKGTITQQQQTKQHLLVQTQQEIHLRMMQDMQMYI